MKIARKCDYKEKFVVAVKIFSIQHDISAHLFVYYTYIVAYCSVQ